MLSTFSGVSSTSLMLGAKEDDFLRMYSGLHQHHHIQQQQQHRHTNIYAVQPSRPNTAAAAAKVSAMVHKNQLKHVHLRSQSMPEDVYLQQQQLQQQQQHQPHGLPQMHQQQQLPRQRLSIAPSNNVGPRNVSLKRSTTNAADLRLTFINERLRRESATSTNSLNMIGAVTAARSRSNIAALNWNLAENELHPAGGGVATRSGSNLSRAVSFYHREHQQQPIHSARSMGFLGTPLKDLSRPLHVDCSVEYDLGNQPKIPPNSAPLLIIHPAYQPRFHPYTSSSNAAFAATTTIAADGSANPPPHIEFSCENEISEASHQQQFQRQQPWSNTRYSLGTRFNASHQHPLLPSRLDYELTQSAPPKQQQHRIKRHSSFLVGGGVSTRHVPLFRPITVEEESFSGSLFNNSNANQQTRSFVHFAGASAFEPYSSSSIYFPTHHLQHQHQQQQQHHYQQHLQQQVGAGPSGAAVKRSKSVYQPSKNFHLSMPDISFNEIYGIKQQQQQLPGQSRRQRISGLLQNGQHHHPTARARMNLETKLEAVRKMSCESRDSGTSLDSNPTDGPSLVPFYLDDDASSSASRSDSSIVDVVQAAEDASSDLMMTTTTSSQPSHAFSDSGLGTPSSLMDHDDPYNSPSSASSSTSSRNSYNNKSHSSSESSTATSAVKKWKSSVSDGSQVVWRAFVSSLKCMHF